MDNAILTGLGLAFPAGLNAYLPLLILALADRFSGRVTLDRPYDILSSGWGIAVLVVLLTVEIVVDKIPGIDHANDLVQSAIRPASGAVMMMSVTHYKNDMNPVIAMLIGLFAAGAVHAVKATARPAITITTGGVGNPVVSIVEDAVAALTSITAILVPILALILFFLSGAFLLWLMRRIGRFVAALIRPSQPNNLRR